ncbi:MAG: UDP-glucuronic acid decarboxylase family protein [Verrucomicrobiales bacterium]
MPLKRILITGGAGFIGSHLCHRLVREGHDVICLDNLMTSQKSNIADLLGEPNFEFIRHDITLPVWLEVDEIYNLACPASPPHYQFNPVKTIKTCVVGSINMLGMAQRNRAKILQTSTSEVYGDPQISPQSESYLGNVNPVGVRACYDEGKRCAETLFFDYHRMHGLDIKVARLFNTYGPIMHPFDERVVSNFIVHALTEKKMTLHGDGLQTRSFCYVDDTVEALVRLMDTPNDFHGPVNIGNPGEFTIKELAEMTAELLGDSGIEMTYLPRREDDPMQRRPDITLAKEVLDWEPTVPLREGLAKTIEYFKSLDLSHFRRPTPAH